MGDGIKKARAATNRARVKAPIAEATSEPVEDEDLLALMGAAIISPNKQHRDAARSLVLGALRAAVVQSKVWDAYMDSAPTDAAFDATDDAWSDARRETNEAGFALAKALHAAKGAP